MVVVRFSTAVILSGALALAGCAHQNSNALARSPQADPAFSDLVPVEAPSEAPAAMPGPQPFRVADTPKTGKLIVTPEKGLIGKVVSFNSAGRFVVLNFPVGHVPAQDQQLSVYRLGLKVGELKATNLRNDDYVVADLLTGEADAGDQVRDK